MSQSSLPTMTEEPALHPLPRRAATRTQEDASMSTNAAIVVRDPKVDGGQTIAVIYKHHDGHPDSLLVNLKRIFAGLKVGGLPATKDSEMYVNCNDLDDFAAQVVVALKDSPGEIYLYPGGSENDISVQWTYIFTTRKGEAEYNAQWLWVEIRQGDAEGTYVWKGYLNDWRPGW